MRSHNGDSLLMAAICMRRAGHCGTIAQALESSSRSNAPGLLVGVARVGEEKSSLNRPCTPETSGRLSAAGVTSVKVVEKRVSEEVAKGQAAMGGILAGSASISGGVSSTMPSICM
jgi:hypothetical protein